MWLFFFPSFGLGSGVVKVTGGVHSMLRIVTHIVVYFFSRCCCCSMVAVATLAFVCMPRATSLPFEIVGKRAAGFVSPNGWRRKKYDDLYR